MIRTRPDKTEPDMVRVTFALTDDRDVSVAGDFNDWDTEALPLRRRSNGTKSAAVSVPSGTVLRFRYVTADGAWFDELEAEHEPNGFGETNSLITVA